jgi:hypothetical protein
MIESRLHSRDREIFLRVNQRHRSVATTLLVILFAAGALICLVTMLALAFPGGFLEPIWRLKPEARVEFQRIGNWSVSLMAVVGAACGLAAIGLAKNAEWGRRFAIVVLTVNVFGDLLNALLRHDPRTLIGLPIGGLMILYLLKRRRSET